MPQFIALESKRAISYLVTGLSNAQTSASLVNHNALARAWYPVHRGLPVSSSVFPSSALTSTVNACALVSGCVG